MPIKIVIGLGNAEPQYALTRHNVGAILLGELASDCGVRLEYEKYSNAYAAKCRIANVPAVLAFANGYMNLSGQNIKKILAFYKFDISETLVIYDDIALEPGRMKLNIGGSAGGHNGVDDIIRHCGNTFLRLRVGIGAKPDKRMDLAEYVLGRIPTCDLILIKSLKFKECIASVLTMGVEAAQNIFNSREKPLASHADDKSALKQSGEPLPEVSSMDTDKA